MPDFKKHRNSFRKGRELFLGIVELSVPPEVAYGQEESIAADSRNEPDQDSQFTLLLDVFRLDGSLSLFLSLVRDSQFQTEALVRVALQFAYGFDACLIAGNRRAVVERFRDFNPEEGRQWWIFEVDGMSTEGVEVQLFEDVAVGETRRVKLTGVHQVHTSEQEFLQQLASLASVPDATDSQLQQVLGRLNSGPDGVVAVYDVGQASCNALTESTGRPVLYFDIGYPLPFNARSAPLPTPIHYERGVPIVLSHWDFDHWGAARRPRPQRWNIYAVSATWIAPRQYLGPMHLSLASAIQQHGKLLIWGLKRPSHISFANGEIVKCMGPKKLQRNLRNDTGLAFYAVDSGKNAANFLDPILMPGDAEFCFIPPPYNFSMHALLGLVASHHGGAIAHPPRGPTYGHSLLAVSVGHPNKYNHPSPKAYTIYQSAGWQNFIETKSRNHTCTTCGSPIGGIGLSLVGGSAAPSCYRSTPCGTCIVQ